MKRLVSLAAALLVAAPGVAMAQEVPGWHFATPNDDKECYAFTTGNVALGFQAPNGDRVGALVLMAPVSVGSGPGETVFTLDVPGPLRGDHVAKDSTDARINMFFFRVESFDDLNGLPDRWHFSARKGGEKIADVTVTGFRAALNVVRQCVAAR